MTRSARAGSAARLATDDAGTSRRSSCGVCAPKPGTTSCQENSNCPTGQVCNGERHLASPSRGGRRGVRRQRTPRPRCSPAFRRSTASSRYSQTMPAPSGDGGGDGDGDLHGARSHRGTVQRERRRGRLRGRPLLQRQGHLRSDRQYVARRRRVRRSKGIRLHGRGVRRSPSAADASVTTGMCTAYRGRRMRPARPTRTACSTPAAALHGPCSTAALRTCN